MFVSVFVSVFPVCFSITSSVLSCHYSSYLPPLSCYDKPSTTADKGGDSIKGKGKGKGGKGGNLAVGKSQWQLLPDSSIYMMEFNPATDLAQKCSKGGVLLGKFGKNNLSPQQIMMMKGAYKGKGSKGKGKSNGCCEWCGKKVEAMASGEKKEDEKTAEKAGEDDEKENTKKDDNKTDEEGKAEGKADESVKSAKAKSKSEESKPAVYERFCIECKQIMQTMGKGRGGKDRHKMQHPTSGNISKEGNDDESNENQVDGQPLFNMDPLLSLDSLLTMGGGGNGAINVPLSGGNPSVDRSDGNNINCMVFKGKGKGGKSKGPSSEDAAIDKPFADEIGMEISGSPQFEQVFDSFPQGGLGGPQMAAGASQTQMGTPNSNPLSLLQGLDLSSINTLPSLSGLNTLPSLCPNAQPVMQLPTMPTAMGNSNELETGNLPNLAGNMPNLAGSLPTNMGNMAPNMTNLFYPLAAATDKTDWDVSWA